MNILIVDDDIADRVYAQSILQSAGHNVSHVHNGSGAIALYKNTQPDLVLMDIVMDDMNGYQAVAKMRKLDVKQVPILFMTSLSQHEIGDEALESGGNGLIHKPCKKVELLEAVENAKADYNEPE